MQLKHSGWFWGSASKISVAVSEKLVCLKSDENSKNIFFGHFKTSEQWVIEKFFSPSKIAAQKKNWRWERWMPDPCIWNFYNRIQSICRCMNIWCDLIIIWISNFHNFWNNNEVCIFFY